MIIAEAWHELLRDYNHWLFEFISGSIQAVIIALILRPVFKRAIRLHDERKHKHVHCEDAHGEQQTLFDSPSLCMYCNSEVDPGYLAHEKCAKESRKK